MGVRTKIDAIDQTFVLGIMEGVSDKQRSATLAKFAREKLSEAQAKNRRTSGRDVPYNKFVDGREGASEDSVKPDGTIVYEFDLVTDLFIWIRDQLRKTSPVKTGRYKENHAFFAGGMLADPEDMEVAKANVDEFVFVSLVPYARKIERGLSSQAPEGVYEVVAALARGRFGNIAKIKFSFRSALAANSMLGRWASTTSMKSRSPSRNKPGVKRRDWLTRQPAIVITLRS